jgi:hypothetical protein
MAIKLVEREWCPEANAYRCSFILDAESDKAKLPEACVGSIAVVANKGGAVYMVNASGEWGEL